MNKWILYIHWFTHSTENNMHAYSFNHSHTQSMKINMNANEIVGGRDKQLINKSEIGELRALTVDIQGALIQAKRIQMITKQ